MKILRKIIIIFGAILLLTVLFFTFFAVEKITGSAMGPDFKEGEMWLLLRQGNIKRGDVVAYSYITTDLYMGRVVGLPGETIKIADKSIYIDGQKFEENYANWDGVDSQWESELPLNATQYLILLDKRSQNPLISHTASTRTDIIGKFFLRLY